MNKNRFIHNLGIIERHLEKNEKWFQKPEEKMIAFEKDMDEWNSRYVKTIQEVEYWIKELERKLEG